MSKWEISDTQFIGIILFYGFAFLLATFNPRYSLGFALTVTIGSIFLMYLNQKKKREK